MIDVCLPDEFVKAALIGGDNFIRSAAESIYRSSAGDCFSSGSNIVLADDGVTGKIACAACDKQRIVYERHPRSGCLLKGYQIPYWDKVMDICREAAHKVPQMGYIGWDVAITKDGPLFIEANNMPGHDAFPQMPLQAPDKIGILPVFQKYIKGL